jgi:hypothetical protein
MCATSGLGTFDGWLQYAVRLGKRIVREAIGSRSPLGVKRRRSENARGEGPWARR